MTSSSGNEDQAGYQQPLHDQIIALIAAGIEADTDDRRGRILVKLADHIAAEDRILPQAVARVIIADSDGPLVEQLSKVRTPTPMPCLLTIHTAWNSQIASRSWPSVM